MGPSEGKQALQWVNYANLVSYFLNLIVTYGVNASDSLPSNGEISEKYQTLVTPAGYAFSIWGIIFASQFIWSLVQMLPQYRAKEVLVNGVSWYYVIVCISQISWSIAFTFDYITLSFLAMIGI